MENPLAVLFLKSWRLICLIGSSAETFCFALTQTVCWARFPPLYRVRPPWARFPPLYRVRPPWARFPPLYRVRPSFLERRLTFPSQRLVTEPSGLVAQIEVENSPTLSTIRLQSNMYTRFPTDPPTSVPASHSPPPLGARGLGGRSPGPNTFADRSLDPVVFFPPLCRNVSASSPGSITRRWRC